MHPPTLARGRRASSGETAAHPNSVRPRSGGARALAGRSLQKASPRTAFGPDRPTLPASISGEPGPATALAGAPRPDQFSMVNGTANPVGVTGRLRQY